MADIGPGTLVRCVDDGPQSRKGFPPPEVLGLDGLRKGAVYTVRDLDADTWSGEPVIRLAEIRRPIDIDGKEAAFASVRFVPLDDSRLDIFRSTLTDTPAKEPVAA